MRPLGKETPTEADLNRFLAQKTVGVWFIDGSILNALAQEEKSTKQSMRWDKPSMIVRANRKLLKQIFDNPAQELASLKLEQGAFATRHMKVSIRFKGNMMRFDIHIVLPKQQAKKVAKLIKERIAARNAKRTAP